ncbi:hypothetical protein ACWE42_09320 [Sutcliffiella cohnii]|uniref:Uncharacterized protein n=1 Tax=Sutcliffiella cohnii TaxID=33932 RepID=A0A223KKP4_9BACI|nr:MULTISPECIES: hypothetical protein [Sutcliffiella]AST89934.1 hypothetical protein BC6307_00890 [Sutcliffiella cohnii]WBL15559.1 hypothetical protein O1A01_02595 [Sutcliffiella sp. NC1]
MSNVASEDFKPFHSMEVKPVCKFDHWQYFLPKDFIVHAAPYLNANNIIELWDVVVCTYEEVNLNKSLDDEQVIKAIVESLRITIERELQQKIHKTFKGYFAAVLINELRDLKSYKIY